LFVGGGSGSKKSLLVEKGQLMDSEGTIRTYPNNLNNSMLTFTNVY
jgi:hypothetical protein